MRLVRCGAPGHERPGLLDADGIVRDLSGFVEDIDGRMLNDVNLAQLRSLDFAALPKIDPQTRYAPCIANVGKFMCIGLNFYDHAKETGLSIPEHPILFMKASSSISGPVTSRGRSVGNSSVIRGMYRGAIPRSVGRFAKFAARTCTHSLESGGGTPHVPHM